ncbi:MAG: hypothetical protein RL434_1955 [Pseudomonadota bacterium]|jgi:homogentisate 1,2-dioxygenase
MKEAADMSVPGYLPGFANEHSTEAVRGAVPVGQFSPQRAPLGLYAEKFSATAFTAPRCENRRTWFYRIHPSAGQGFFEPLPDKAWRTAPAADLVPQANPLRWDPLPIPDAPADFIDGMTTLALCGNAGLQLGMGAHVYLANRSMHDRFFQNSDGELLVLPQQGRLIIHTECGVLEVAPREMALIPRGMKFRVALPDGPSRGYVCENHGALLRLPERGPVGSDGFANDRDFLAPVASYEERTGSFELVAKVGGRFFRAGISHSPLDVVGWVGTAYPVKYPLEGFNTLNTVSYDHPDPSIFTVLTSPSDTPGVANVDFVIFPPRWMVAENTFRPPWFHRNVMSEFMGLIHGQYDARERGFEPGGASLHSCMVPHGPEAAVYAKASTVPLVPQKVTETLAFMFESRYPILPLDSALALSARQSRYHECWQGFERTFSGA